MNIKNFVFAPKWLSTVLTLLLFPFFIALGVWQLHRAEQKELILQQYQTYASHPPLNFKQINDPKKQEFFPVELKGHYDNQHTFLLDNRSYKGQIGYQVLSPFYLQESSQWVLINRGWLAREINREKLPSVPPVTGEQIIQGKIYIPPARKFLLRAETASQQFPYVIQTFDINWMSKMSGQTLLPWAVLLDPTMPNGFVRDWQPTVSPYKNWGYAFQWFTFAAVLLVIYIALNLRRKTNNAKSVK